MRMALTARGILPDPRSPQRKSRATNPAFLLCDDLQAFQFRAKRSPTHPQAWKVVGPFTDGGNNAQLL
jgi:hypothetical protein